MNNNDYGVYKGDIEAGTDEWLVVEMPVELGTASEAIDHYSMSEAITIADYLTQTEGVSFKFGRPNDRHGS